MNSCPIYPILQKFFNSLQALNNLNSEDDLIQDIASLDNFFSEFRNITFVAQKNLNIPQGKEIYDKNKQTYLINQRMKWFVDQRNKVTKENPFNLEKEFAVYLYAQKEVFEKRFKSTSEEEISRNNILKLVINALRLNPQHAYFFTIKLTFLENSKEIDIYEEITYGIKQMNLFVKNLQKDLPCNCDQCNKLNEKISQLLQMISSKEITFIWDCELKEGKLKHAERIELSFGGKDFYEMEQKIKCSLENSFFDKGTNGKPLSSCISSIFFNFTVFHLIIYQQQKHSILPVFMIIYSDNTYVLWPFGSTIKTTFFRVSNEIAREIPSKEIVAVFYAGEYYLKNQKDDPNPKEFFVCSMIDNNLEEKSIMFDSNKVDDMAYCKDRFLSNEKFDQSIFTPIKSEFEKLTQTKVDHTK